MKKLKKLSLDKKLVVRLDKASMKDIEGGNTRISCWLGCTQFCDAGSGSGNIWTVYPYANCNP